VSDLSTQTLVAAAMLGRDAEEFLQGDVGRYLLARAEEEEQEALNALATVWPWRRRRITDLQAKLWRARSFKQWLADLITEGRQSLEQLETPPE
jgi:hypothetical protein